MKHFKNGKMLHRALQKQLTTRWKRSLIKSLTYKYTQLGIKFEMCSDIGAISASFKPSPLMIHLLNKL